MYAFFSRVLAYPASFLSHSPSVIGSLIHPCSLLGSLLSSNLEVIVESSFLGYQRVCSLHVGLSCTVFSGFYIFWRRYFSISYPFPVSTTAIGLLYVCLEIESVHVDGERNLVSLQRKAVNYHNGSKQVVVAMSATDQFS
jgi:hypothetical protein